MTGHMSLCLRKEDDLSVVACISSNALSSNALTCVLQICCFETERLRGWGGPSGVAGGHGGLLGPTRGGAREVSGTSVAKDTLRECARRRLDSHGIPWQRSGRMRSREGEGRTEGGREGGGGMKRTRQS